MRRYPGKKKSVAIFLWLFTGLHYIYLGRIWFALGRLALAIGALIALMVGADIKSDPLFYTGCSAYAVAWIWRFVDVIVIAGLPDEAFQPTAAATRPGNTATLQPVPSSGTERREQ